MSSKKSTCETRRKCRKFRFFICLVEDVAVHLTTGGLAVGDPGGLVRSGTCDYLGTCQIVGWVMPTNWEGQGPVSTGDLAVGDAGGLGRSGTCATCQGVGDAGGLRKLRTLATGLAVGELADEKSQGAPEHLLG